MSELVQGAQRKALVDELLRRGYYGPAVTKAVALIQRGRPTAEILAVLEPEFARAHRTAAWLEAGPTLALETVGEIAEHGETLPPHHHFEDQLRQRKDRE